MVKVMIDNDLQTDKRLKRYMVENDITNKEKAIQKILKEYLSKKIGD